MVEMSDGITDAAKQTAEAVRRFQLQYLKDIPTNLIVDELCKREGVKEIVAYPYDSYRIVRYKHDNPSFVEECGDTGPARILVVMD